MQNLYQKTDHALVPVAGAAAMTKTISSTTITTSSDITTLDARTERLLCQVLTDAVYLNLHGHATPSASNSLVVYPGEKFLMSRGEWLASTWKRVTTDAVLNAQQLA